MATSGVAPTELGSAAGLFNTSQQAGSAAGLSVLATIAAASARSAGGSLMSGFRISYLVATGTVLLGIALTASLLSGKQCQSAIAIQSGVSASHS